MAIIKGQNLRILVEGFCVAAATNSEIHVALNVESATTKDTEDDEWDVKEPIGHSWDAKVDAMVLDGSSSQGRVEEEDTLPCDEALPGGDGYYAPKLIHLRRGEVLKMQGATGARTIFTVYDSSFLWLASSGDVVPNFDYEANHDVDVYIGVSSQNFTVHYRVFDYAKGVDDLIAYLKSGAKVDVEFDKTYANTSQNRDVETIMMKGEAYVQDISIAAKNQEITTYSCQLIGTGDLTTE